MVGEWHFNHPNGNQFDYKIRCEGEKLFLDELLQVTESFKVGQPVQCRDAGKDWSDGVVKSLDPLKVQREGYESYGPLCWDEVRPKEIIARKLSKVTTIPLSPPIAIQSCIMLLCSRPMALPLLHRHHSRHRSRNITHQKGNLIGIIVPQVTPLHLTPSRLPFPTPQAPPLHPPSPLH